MERITLALSLLALVACQTPSPRSQSPSAPQGGTPTESAVAADDGVTNVEGFVKACQAKSGINFTYTQATQAAMATTAVRVEDVQSIPSSDVERFVAATLEGYGFSCEHIGPDHLHVLLIKLKSG